MPSPELLIDAIYDGVWDPSAPRRIANLLRERYAVGTALLGIYGRDGRVLRMSMAGFDEALPVVRERVALYEERYRSRDFISLMKGDTISVQNIGARFRADPFYAEFLRAIDCAHINLIRVPFGELVFGISLIRGEAELPFSDEATRDFFDLAAHFRRSARLYRMTVAAAPGLDPPPDTIVFVEPEDAPGLATPAAPAAAVADRTAALSQAERDIVVKLRAGMKLREIAAQRGVSYETVRTQVKRALTKTGARGQAHLVGLLP